MAMLQFIIYSSMKTHSHGKFESKFTELVHYQMHLFPPVDLLVQSITFCFLLKSQHGTFEEILPLPNPQRVLTARQHDLVNPELFYSPIV